jgi:hypothetical protein
MRRTFLASSMAASALAATGASTFLQSAQGPTEGKSEAKGREFYQLRRYLLSSGPQRKLCDDFFRDALVPALNRLGITPVGVFAVTIGPETPAFYVLMPGASAETLALVETRLAQDAAYMKAGAPFLNAPAAQPSFNRMESILLQAFEKTPKLILPAGTAARSPRIFELRTYESPSDQDHKRKVEMMQSGEGDIFAKYGFAQVFYGDGLIGTRLPSLTYMLAFDNLADREKKWAAFIGSPEWKKFSAEPRWSFEPIVSNITNIILTPTDYSQI